MTLKSLEASASFMLGWACKETRRNTTSKKKIEGRLSKKESLQEIAKAYKRNKRDWLLWHPSSLSSAGTDLEIDVDSSVQAIIGFASIIW
jgi:hypothetical protein